MPRSVPSLVDAKMLAWARKTARVSIADAAKKLKLEATQLEAWELGDGGPTLAQLRVLAELYKRPLAVLYLPEPPPDFTPLRDFRRLPGQVAGVQSPELTEAIRRAQQRRETALDLWTQVEGKPPQFDARANLDDDPEKVAVQLRDWLRVPLATQRHWGIKQAFRGWRAAAEARGVLVFQAGGVAHDEMRGFSIAEYPVPVIAVNSKESFGPARAFTVLHELGHLMLRISGLCDLVEYADRRPEEQRVEVWCNALAAATLLPADTFLDEPELRQRRGPEGWPDDVLQAIGVRYGASRPAVLRRILTFERTTKAYYVSRTKAWDDEYRNRPKVKAPPVKYHVRVVNANGLRYTRLVLNAYHERAITLSSVSDYLGLKLNHLDAVEQFALGPRRST